VPLLPEVLDALGEYRVQLFLELKAPGTPGLAAAAVRAAGWTDRVTFLSFRLEHLAEVAHALPAARLGALFDGVPEDGVARARALGCTCIHAGHARADAALAAAVRAAGLGLVLWTPNAEAELRRAVDLGPDGVTTDRPDRLLALLGRGAARGGSGGLSDPDSRA
jgi:glycerophosphoryl diester phosphodiesterase